MGRPPFKLTKWEQVNVRIEPTLFKAMKTALTDPLYLRLPPGKIQDFINAAIRHELELRGLPCAIAFSESTTSPKSSTETEFF